MEHIQQPNERIKELIELSISCGRCLQSPQTGYIHYYYHNQEEEAHHTIPILENILFSLALFRSRIIENITEAKEILSHLLIFQNQGEAAGNFPVYLHEYPMCRDPLLGIHLLASFYWILKGFGHVLGPGLKVKLEEAIRLLLHYGFRIAEKEPLPYSVTARLAAASQAFGRLWADSHWENRGSVLLGELLHSHATDSWHITKHVSDLIVALQMVYPSIQNSPWKCFWDYLGQTWHRHTCTYVGPCLKEEQRNEEPEPALYDLFLGYFSGQYSQRMKSFAPYHLQAALIQPSEDQVPDYSLPFQVQDHHQGQQWIVRQEQEWAYTGVDKKQLFNSVRERTYTPFRFVWGEAKRVHTLVCQGGNCSTVVCQADENRVKLQIELGKAEELDELEKQREVNFYLDFHPDMKIGIDGQSATVFELGQKVTIQSGSRLISLMFELTEGKGQFLGHLMRGNRPAQIGLKGNNRFNAYDWHLVLRTIRRAGICRLTVWIEMIS